MGTGQTERRANKANGSPSPRLRPTLWRAGRASVRRALDAGNNHKLTPYYSNDALYFVPSILATHNRLEPKMRESFYVPTSGVMAPNIDGAVAMVGDNVVANKAEAEREDQSDERIEDPQPLQEDRRDVQHSAPISNDDDEDCRTTASPDDMHDEYCLESAPSMDALALSCLLFTKEETIKALEAELEQVRSQLSALKPPPFVVDSNIRLEETVATWNKELLSKQGQELVLETQIATRDNAILRLKEDLARANRRVSELEVKLEFHDFKFVSYENHFREEKGNLSSDPKSKSAGRSYSEKLVSDLQEIEKLYISAKQDFAEKAERLQRECNEYKAKYASMLRTREPPQLPPLQCPQQASDVEDSDDVDVPKTFMQKKIKLLETELKSQSDLTSCLHSQVADLTASLLNKEKKQKQEMHAMRRSKAALESKVAAMKKQWKAGSGGVLNQEFQSLETNMEELLSEISRLEARLRTKERIISKLQETLSEGKQAVPSPVEKELCIEEMPVDHIPVENCIVICEPLPNDFVETHQPHNIFGGNIDSFDDEPSI